MEDSLEDGDRGEDGDQDEGDAKRVVAGLPGAVEAEEAAAVRDADSAHRLGQDQARGEQDQPLGSRGEADLRGGRRAAGRSGRRRGKLDGPGGWTLASRGRRDG